MSNGYIFQCKIDLFLKVKPSCWERQFTVFLSVKPPYLSLVNRLVPQCISCHSASYCLPYSSLSHRHIALFLIIVFLSVKSPYSSSQIIVFLSAEQLHSSVLNCRISQCQIAVFLSVRSPFSLQPNRRILRYQIDVFLSVKLPYISVKSLPRSSPSNRHIHQCQTVVFVSVTSPYSSVSSHRIPCLKTPCSSVTTRRISW